MENRMIKALELVESLNNETLIDGVSLGTYEPFEFRSIGIDSSIAFMGEIVWNEDLGCSEIPLREHVIKQSKKILSDLNKRMKEI